MKLNCTVLFVKDIARSKDFYTSILDQKVMMDFGMNITFEGGFAIWQLREHHPVHQRIAKEDANAFELYFEDASIKTFAERLNSHDVKLLHDLIEEPWGQLTIRFYDPDGHLIEVGEPLEVFLQRMYDEGMSIEDIHNKSGVPVEQLNNTIKK